MFFKVSKSWPLTSRIFLTTVNEIHKDTDKLQCDMKLSPHKYVKTQKNMHRLPLLQEHQLKFQREDSIVSGSRLMRRSFKLKR